MAGMSLAALDAVVWVGLETAHPLYPVEVVPRTLRRLALAGAEATEEDCHPLHDCLTAWHGPAPSAAATALPFVVQLAADPAMRVPVRVTLVELLVDMDGPEPAKENRAGARALLADPDPAVRRAAIPLAGGVARLLERWRVETDPTVRLPVLLALGEAAAGAPAGTGEDAAARAVLAEVLRGGDPVLWVAALDASAALEPELTVRQMDRLVEVFSDLALRPRFEEVWYTPGIEGPWTREDLVRTTARLFEHIPGAQLSFAVSLIEAARRTGDAALLREALDLAWLLLTQRLSVAATLLPHAGELLADPDGPVRLRAANILAVLGGPAAAPYADRLAALLHDTAEDEYLEGTVGEFARWALARIGDPRALPGLVEQLYAPYREQHYSRSYGSGDPRLPDIPDVLIPLRAHAGTLLPAVREAIRHGGATGGATGDFLRVLEAWGQDALPALPDLLPLLASTRTSIPVIGVLTAMGPAAASAEPALRACRVLDHPGNHAAVAAAAMRITGDRAAALRFLGDAVLAGEAPVYGPVGALADFGPDAAPYADRVRSVMERSSHGTRLTAAITLWSITGRTEPTMGVLEEYVLPVAGGGDGLGVLDTPGLLQDALHALIRMGEVSPAIRAALLTARGSDRRLSTRWNYEGILQDERLRALIDEALGHEAPIRPPE
ncbi:HEAT repeat domain-containing protein [Streptomyces sp. NPDC057137]|uniref:HEAT repeat domain-containing protein n=1 Tax=Streptomyces sp. NPDC057137 TaxID=3346030 RepID=UPI00363FDF8A